MNVPRTGPTIGDGFEKLLEAFSLSDLEVQAGSVFGLWRDFRIGYLNPAWRKFAAENGGEPAISERWNLNSVATEAIPVPLKPFYLNLYLECLESSQPKDHDYECSSGRLYRRFRMTVYPLAKGEGLLVVNSLRVERPRNQRLAGALLESDYVNGNGLMHQCCHCRRTQRMDNPDQWDWVPEFVSNMPLNTSHSLCPICFDYYYRPSVPRG